MRFILVVILILLIFLYIPLNRQTPRYSFKSKVDDRIPLLPWTVWIYISYYLLLPISIILTWNSAIFIPFISIQIAVTFLASLIWWLFPNGVTRPQIGLVGNRSHNLLSNIYYYDQDCNGLPSNHILHSYVSCYFLALTFPHFWLLFFLLGLFISLSTLTTKQHYFLDAASTLLLIPLVFEVSMYIITL